MSVPSLFSPYRDLPNAASYWWLDPPVLAAPVGWQQPNFPEDVLLLQRIVNIIIDHGYLQDQIVGHLLETGA